jgi:hypothetical protein
MGLQVTLTAAELRSGALEIWHANLGYGETGKNNHGKFLIAIGAVRLPVNWCALFTGYGYRKTHENAGETPPEWLFRAPGVPEPGARRLCNAMAGVRSKTVYGVRWTSLDEALPGDMLLYDRPGPGCHVAGLTYASEGVAHTIEGNRGRFPARVREWQRQPHDDPDFLFGVGLRDRRA